MTEIHEGSTAEEVTACRVRLKLTGFTGVFDNPITGQREDWYEGRWRVQPTEIGHEWMAWMVDRNPDPKVQVSPFENDN